MPCEFPERVENIAQARAVVGDAQRFARRRIQDRRRSRGRGACPQAFDRRAWPRGFDALADDPVDLGNFGRR
jgi:hypothetical protein